MMKPNFDAISPEQEALALEYARRIADGFRPDAISILEWAEALYLAEVAYLNLLAA